MKASTLLSALVVLVFFVTVSSGIRYTVNFSGLVGRLCGASGSQAPSGCPDSSPPFISSSPTALPSGASFSSFPIASASPGASSNPGSSSSSSPRASGVSASASPSVGSIASSSASPSVGSIASSSAFPSGFICPSQSSCPTTSSCTPCICETPSSFPSFSRSPSPTSAASLSGSASGTNTASRSISASLTASPSPNPCGPQYEASSTNSFGVGLLFDRTAWARDNSNPAVYGALYAISQINAAGGIQIGGKNVSLSPVFYDTQGLPNNTVEGANSLTRVSCVSVMIGTENSAQRRSVQTSVLDSTASSNAAPGLLLNPQNYNGLDADQGTVNFGSNLLTNVRHAIDYGVANNKTHMYLLGSDDSDSRVINAYARQYIANTYPSVLIIGEGYIPVGASEFTAQQTFLNPLFLGASLFNTAVGNPCPLNSRNQTTACTMALSTVYGQAANRILYQALAARYLTPNNPNMPYTVMALRNSIYEFLNFTDSNVNNQLIGANYLDSVDVAATPAIASWKAGLVNFITSANIINDTNRINTTNGVELRAYNAIRLWANAVAAAGTANPSVIRSAILNATFNAPNGLVSVNATSREASTATTPFYIARLNTPPLQGLQVTNLLTYSDAFVQYPAPVGNLTSPDSYSSLVNGIRSYYVNSQSAQVLAISQGWEYPAIPSPTSK